MGRYAFIDDDAQDNYPHDIHYSPRLMPPLHKTSGGTETGGTTSETENEPPAATSIVTAAAAATQSTRRSKGRSTYAVADFLNDDDEWLERKMSTIERLGGSPKPPAATTHINTGPYTVPMQVLVRDAHRDAIEKAAKQHSSEAGNYAPNDDDGFGDLLDTFQAIALTEVPTSSALAPQSRLGPPADPTYGQLGQKEKQVHEAVQQIGHKLRMENEKFEKYLQAMMDKERRDEEKRRQLQAQRQAAAQEEKRQQAAAAAAKEKQQQAEKAKAEEDRQRAKEAAEAKAKKDAAAKAKKQEETAFVTKAKERIKYLAQVQQSVQPFDKSKPMAQRRLAMKKIVNGRVNTLSEDADKINAVAADVNAAITQARQDDATVKAQIEGGNTAQYSKEMAIGKRYFLDLLSSKVVVRVQAEGFNGQRGDGFPLAHMLAQVAKANEDFEVIMAPHIYRVCPTAIPLLPTPAKNASEEELMESLGMQKKKDGTYETFERFLSRTEGIISIVANIQSSTPPDHGLFGGAKGAVKWLERFLNQLPSPPHSPLPLITAPVLDAFLTGAGHMLANCFEDEFKKLFAQIESGVMTRLDEGTIGAPSAIRLRKTVKEGFDGFKTKLPSRAIPVFYHGASSPPAGAGVSQPGAASGFASPFGTAVGSASTLGGAPTAASSSATPFSNTSTSASPFGGGQAPALAPSTSSQSPFGANKTAQSPSPFGLATNAAGQSPSPFGINNAPSPFGASSAPTGNNAFGNTPSTAPFGGQAASPFTTSSTPSGGPFGQNSSGSTPFGSQTKPSTPFGGTGMAPSPSPFTASNTPSSSAFGQKPFGNQTTSVAAGQSTFGITPSASPFTASNTGTSTPFGSQTANATAGQSTFGIAPSPSPFTASNTGTSTPFGSQTKPSTPFGGTGMAPSPSPFTASNTPSSGAFGQPSGGNTPFGGQATSSPFGGGKPQTGSGVFGQPSMGGGQSPFGSPSPNSTGLFGQPASGSTFGTPSGGFSGGASTFGSNTPFSNQTGSSPFAGATGATPPTSFGGNNTQKQPCKYFAKGQCKFGNQCRYSHDIQPSTTSFSNPFGGPRR